MHLCVDARMIGSAGIGRLLKDQLPLFSSRFRLTLLHLEKDRAELAGYANHFITMKSPIYSLKEQLELPLKIPACDLFYSPHFNIPLLPIRAKKRVATIHDVYHLAHLSEFSWLQRCYAKLFYNSVLRLSDRTVTISEFSKNQLLSHCTASTDRLTILLNGLSRLFQSLEQKKVDKTILLAVGNIKPHKNLYRLLRAYEKLQPQEPLWIVGRREGFLKGDQKLLSLVEKSPFLQKQVHFTGYVADEKLPEFYASAKAFLFPSLYEGFGFPPLEAMACGCPVVASRAASIPEVCGEAAEYVDPHDVDSIAQGMERVLADPQRREELIQKGYERVKKFPVEKCVEGYVELFERVVKE